MSQKFFKRTTLTEGYCRDKITMPDLRAGHRVDDYIFTSSCNCCSVKPNAFATSSASTPEDSIVVIA